MSSPRKELAIRSCLILMGVLTAFPVLAVISPAQLTSYGVTDPGLIELTLLQHRGLLQFVLGASLGYAAFKPDIRVPVAIAAIFTKGGALLLTASRPEVLAEASAVMIVFDPICITLLIAILADARLRRSSQPAARAPSA